jgi:exodeoxyribonuclease V alpha subunit
MRNAASRAAIERLLSTSSFLGERIANPKDKGHAISRGALDFHNADLFGTLSIRLDEEQIGAAREALQQKVFVITGGPGTGKTTLLMSLLTVLRRAKVSFALAAPTGRAAKRMTESTGEEAMTLHRLLEYNPREGAFQRHEDNPLQVDVVIVDEASMVDLTLMDYLLRAIDPTQSSHSGRGCRSVAVGGSGSVLGFDRIRRRARYCSSAYFPAGARVKSHIGFYKDQPLLCRRP